MIFFDKTNTIKKWLQAFAKTFDRKCLFMKFKNLLSVMCFVMLFSSVMPTYGAYHGERFPVYGSTIATGGSTSFAVQPDGTLWAWGSGNLGYGGIRPDGYLLTGWGERIPFDGVASSVTPLRIMDDVVAVSAGMSHAMAIKSDGSLWAWGSNTLGQLGDGTTIGQRSPVKIMEDVIYVSAGNNFTMAITADGSLWAWGSNRCIQGNVGLLGDGTTINRHVPVKIMENVVAVSAGFQNTMAIRADGSLWAWGTNLSGMLGDGTTTGRNEPVRIMDEVKTVSLMFSHTMAIRTDGTLWAWGSNFYGMLGDGTTTDRHSPIKIMEDVVSVSAGVSFTTAIRRDGSLWAWGYNSSGQLGDGTTIDRHSPVKIMEDVVAVSSGGVVLSTHIRGHSLAIRTDGSLWAWGHNRGSQLGDGTWINRSYPVKIMESVMLPRDFSFAEPPIVDLPILRFGIGNNYFLRYGEVQRMEVAPFVSAGRTMIPFRIVVEALGAEARWDRATQTVIVTKDGDTINLVVDVPLPNNMGVPVIVNGVTFVPARYISEALGATVRWDRENDAIYVYRAHEN